MSARIGFVGAGWWTATAHAPAVQRSARGVIAGVVDPDDHRAGAFSERFGCPTHASLRAMHDAEQLDGVVIATPHALHAPLAKEALDLGLGVLVEKPMALSAVDAWDISARSTSAALPVVVSHPYLFHPHARLVRTVLSSGRLGHLVSVTGVFDSVVSHLIRGDVEAGPSRDYAGFAPRPQTYSDPALAGGGQAQTQLGHLVSLLVAELDQRIVDVDATMYFEQRPMDLALSASARTDDGAVIAISSSGTLRSFDDRSAWIRYTGTDGWLLHDALNGRVVGSDGPLDDPAIPSAQEAYPTHAPVLELIGLLDQAAPADELLASAENGALTTEFIEACYSSALSK